MPMTTEVACRVERTRGSSDGWPEMSNGMRMGEGSMLCVCRGAAIEMVQRRRLAPLESTDAEECIPGVAQRSRIAGSCDKYLHPLHAAVSLRRV